MPGARAPGHPHAELRYYALDDVVSSAITLVETSVVALDTGGGARLLARRVRAT